MTSLNANNPAPAPQPPSSAADFEYSDKYEDSQYEYRHVIIPKDFVKKLPSPLRCLSEDEWRALGVLQSRGWVHYEIHKPEPHVLLFRRLLGTDAKTGKFDPKLLKMIQNEKAQKEKENNNFNKENENKNNK